MTVRILCTAALSAALVFSACGKKAEPPANAAPAPAAAAPAAADAASSAGPPATKGVMTDAELPAACRAFIDLTEACAVKREQTQDPAGAEVLRSAIRETRADWAGRPVEEDLTPSCQQAYDVFEAADNGC
jgi:hypothetical protein